MGWGLLPHQALGPTTSEVPGDPLPDPPVQGAALRCVSRLHKELLAVVC